jgi:hypothetical protein
MEMDDNTYYILVESTDFVDKLNILNNNLKKELENNKYIPTLIGNLFYDHEQMNPPFYNSPLLKDCEEKRIRFSKACKMRTTMFEIGLNGGHSSFLAMNVNENLTVYSNDIAEFYQPCPNIHPEIYVPEAARTLKSLFNNRFNFIKGSCITEVPTFVKNNPNMIFDIIHIDGAKETYKQDFLNLMPLLKDNSIVIFDDSQIQSVQKIVNYFIRQGYLHRISDFQQMSPNIKYRNEILIYKI